jgi:penicillin-binding protein 1A
VEDNEDAIQETPPAAPSGRTVVRVARRAIFIMLFVSSAALGALGGVLFAYGTDLPEISRLDDYRPNTITRLLAEDGSVVAQFATERRVVVRYDDIAPALRQAIIATEDAGFEKHFGLNVARILVTVMRDILFRERTGASTITQQLARDQFLTEYRLDGVFARSGLLGAERKIKEMLIAMQMERRYTKREIFTFYANQINLGPGVYGVEAAARMYFGKSAKDVTLDEAATLAAVIQTPGRVNPFNDLEATRNRRNNTVLPRMVDAGFITSEQAKEARSRPLEVRGRPQPDQSRAPYFAEEIRKKLEAEYGADVLYQAGLTVQTTLDAELQAAANRALDRGLRQLDKRRNGYRRPTRNVIAEGSSVERFTPDRWSAIAAGDIVPAVVKTVPAKGSVKIVIAGKEVDLPARAFAWTRRTAAALFKPGDVIEVEVRGLEKGVPSDLVLEQPPAIEGALVAIDNASGQIRAMAGGFSFSRSKFNRATQARRQVGSLFKPFVYTAAIDRGYTPVTIFVDEPVSYDLGPGQLPYEPKNYDLEFKGPVTLRHALEDSRNIPAVQAMAALGPEEVVAYAQRFGLRGNFPPYLSLALGAAEATLIDMTSAYAAYPNQGVRMEPYAVISITDRDGTVLEERRPEPKEAIRADTAFIMTNLMRGVVLHGTAAAAASLKWPLAGKTGTVDDNTDAWFIGFDPNLTIGVWVGYDEKKSLGPKETGASAALPIWIEVMRAYLNKHADRRNPIDFEAPGNIVFVTLDTGETEAFINGTQPQEEGAPLVPAPLPTPAPVVPPAPPVAPAAAVTN